MWWVERTKKNTHPWERRGEDSNFPSGLRKNFFSMFLSLISIAALVFVVIQGKALIRKLA